MAQDSLKTSIVDAIEPYNYEPLAQGCIRLIRLLPGNNEDPIQCEISPYTLKPGRVSGPFDALSYVWGDNQQPGTVHVHNTQQNTTRPLLITKNLHAALAQLRDPEISKTLWIDAICINQADLQERASQVRMMAQIYSHAARVVVWLGQSAEDSEAVFNVLLLLAQRSLRPQSDQDLNLTRIANLKIHPLKALLHRAWFNRVWVLQEVAAARCVSITCGPSELMSYDFLRGLKAWFEMSKINDDSLLDLKHSILHLMDKEVTRGLTSFSHYIPENDFEDTKDEGPGLQAREIELASRTVIRLEPSTSLQIASLAELLQRFQLHAATDRRDKVYALLGMCTDNMNHPGLQVDYTKDWATLFRGIIQYLLGLSVSIMTRDTEEAALILGPGCPLGTLRRVGGGWHVDRPSFGGIRTDTVSLRFNLHMEFDKNIQTGDILCLMQGARLPNLIRRCGDYFVVVRMAIQMSSIVMYHGRSVSRSMKWSEFLPCISRFSRDFLLIWDWSPEVKTCANHHHKLIESTSTGEPSTEKLNRYLNMVRILEDLGEKNLLEDMLSSPSAPQLRTASPTAHYFDVLRHMCEHWNSYENLKAFISQQRWSRWILECPGVVDAITDFWKSEGLSDCDLYEILSMTATYDRSEAFIPTEMENEFWEFGEVTTQPLLQNISPSFAQIAAKTAAGSSKSLSRRYLTRVVFYQAQKSNLNPEQLLEMLSGSPQLLEASRLCLASLAEVSGVALRMTPIFLPRKSPVSQPVDWKMMTYLLETSFLDSPSILNVFERAQSRYYL
ncbi:hypothetical protein E8E13_001942 [Curvularia kusanoi]|uniref:Heterokaryon incompatibility domain-containing protein n=1 Tax=Curvularia kusanoi TaxID=90978 RepID=A0A9P4T3R6_CURKU|nr:hypothetical protein E8E13_001942 [Curvularia kusanoi]